MANILKVSIQTTIYTLADQGWSRRRIARELQINRETVGRHLRERAKPAISITGSDGEAEPKPAISISGKTAGRDSLCGPLAEVIEAKVVLGLHARRIHQDVVAEQGFAGSYQSVQRFVRRLKEREPERVWRLECQPGEEAQVDFGLGAPIYEEAHPKGRRCWVFRLVLSHSRKGYSEAVSRRNPGFSQNRRSAVESSFDSVESSFDSVESSFHSVESSFHSVESLVDAVESKRDAVKSSFYSVEYSFH